MSSEDNLVVTDLLEYLLRHLREVIFIPDKGRTLFAELDFEIKTICNAIRNG